MKRIFFVVASLAVLGGVILASIVFGYFTHREQIAPLFGLAERAIVKGRRELGMPTETVGTVARIETTYLTLKGTTYLMPDNDFLVGGALTTWRDEVLVLHQTGRILRLDENLGLVDTNLPIPDNNLDAYAALAAAEYPDQFPRVDALRYNDIEFIDSAAFRGLVLSYTYIDTNNACYVSRVSKLEIPADVTSIRDLSIGEGDWETLFDTAPCLPFNETRDLIVGYMAGGRMAFKAPNLLYLGSGEYHKEGFYRPDAGIQSDESDYGKTIEIDIRTGDARHYSKGHRNLQGVTLDAEGRLWTTEHGMRGGDELNLIRDGENCGWPLENLGTLYSGIPAPTAGRDGRHEIYEAPVYAWLPSAAVSSLALVDGFHETWDGDLLIGSLKGRTLFRARIQDERIVFLEPIPIGQRIRDVMQVSDDQIALWLDTNELVIFEIEERVDPLDGLIAGLVEDGMAQEMAETAHAVLTGCNECHSYQENVHGAGPSLYGVADRDIASTAFANYSDALQELSGTWTRDVLTAYLTAPEALAEGTAMTGLGVGDPEVASAVSSAFFWLDARRAVGEER